MGLTSANHLDLPPFSSDETFELFVTDLYRVTLGDPHVQRNGRSGQEQHGVDVFGRDTSHNWIGVQCKVRKGVLTTSELDEEIKRALGFNPRISKLIVATTARRDQVLQDYTRKRTTKLERQGRFAVTILFWDDIQELLADDKYLSVLQKYFGGILVEVLKSGVSLCRTMVFRLGVRQVTTGYEVLIGKTAPPADPTSHWNLDYYRGVCFLSDLNARSMTIFSWPCNRYDIYKAISNRTDAYMISKWLNRHISIDEVLTADDEEAMEVISREEWVREVPDIEEDDS